LINAALTLAECRDAGVPGAREQPASDLAVEDRI
jgi:hypothetical protein